MVKGLKTKTRKSPSVQLDYIITIIEIKPWPPSQSLRSLRSALIQWEYSEKYPGTTKAVAPLLAASSGVGDGFKTKRPEKMSGAVMVAVSAAIGNMIQGWDNACIAGAVLYIKKEFNLQNEPTIEGLIVAMSLIGATLVTTCSGAVSDSLGRRPMLIISSILYFFGGLVMLWSPNVYMLLLGRLLDGLGIGLVVTLVLVYISEISPPEIRGSLNTLPQFMGSGGMFLSYCMVLGCH